MNTRPDKEKKINGVNFNLWRVERCMNPDAPIDISLTENVLNYFFFPFNL